MSLPQSIILLSNLPSPNPLNILTLAILHPNSTTITQNESMKSISIFCGAGDGNHPKYKELAYEVGKTLACKNIQIIYGGAKVGMMGAVADGALDHGGKVVGVLPDFLGSREIRHDHLTELISVESMHERKAKMADLSDGAIALPGGFGTLDELFEILTWRQLDIYKGAVGVLNHDGYYDHMKTMLSSMSSTDLLKTKNHQMLNMASDISTLLEKMGF